MFTTPTRPAEPSVAFFTVASGPSFLRRRLSALRTYVRQSICGLNGGHDMYLHRDGVRVTLRCTCGHETPGWLTGGKHYQPRYSGDPARLRLQR